MPGFHNLIFIIPEREFFVATMFYMVHDARTGTNKVYNET